MTRAAEYRIAAIVILVHVSALIAGYYILAATFEFPDILRMPADYRLALFLENSRIIVPAYYLLALTGISQILVTVLVHQALDENEATVAIVAAVFGVLTGVFQAIGFIRWSVLIPYIADAMANAGTNGLSQETVAFIEGVANRYVGMAVGEHLGFLAQATWTTLLGVAILGRRLFDRRLAWIGVVIGLLTFPVAMEPLGGLFVVLGVLTVPVNAAWDIWLILLAISLLRTDPETRTGPRFGWKILTAAAIVWLLNVVPVLMR